MTLIDTKNPLLDPWMHTRFDLITVDHIDHAVEFHLARCEEALERAVNPSTPADYHVISEVLDVPLQDLSGAWGIAMHLQNVRDSPELRKVIAANQPKVTAFYSKLGSDVRLYERRKEVAKSQVERLTPSERKALSNNLTASRMAGAELANEAKSRFAGTMQRSAELERQFSNRLQDATDQFVLYASATDLRGLPEDVLAAMSAKAEADGHAGLYKVTLQQPSLGPVLQFSQSRELREMVYKANATRASEFGPPDQDNGPVVAEIMALRHERASLLGLPHHAAVSLIPKMADSAEQIGGFLRELARSSRAAALSDFAQLQTFAAERLDMPDLKAWDLSFVSEKMRQDRYSFSEQEVKEYFQLETVLAGLFEIAETLFDISIQPDTLPAWHPSVLSYRVERQGELLGQFYLDPYSREKKRAGAWMNGARPRWLMPSGKLRTPLAYLVCNFGAPAEGRPALLRHSEVVTLFHEFGHGLHFLLTKVSTLGVSGISGVEWDAVELPSQLMENFAWEWPILQKITSRVDTGEPLPRPLYEKMVAAKNFQIGLFITRQVELGLFDITLHASPQRAHEAQAVLDGVRREVSVVPTPAYNRFQNSFSHIFAGGYAAGYYSYLWAEVLSADAWGQFQASGVASAETGTRYRKSILEVGGSRPMKESFEAFVGRQPDPHALLKQRGLLTA